jgi:hypothetical protein
VRAPILVFILVFVLVARGRRRGGRGGCHFVRPELVVAGTEGVAPTRRWPAPTAQRAAAVSAARCRSLLGLFLGTCVLVAVATVVTVVVVVITVVVVLIVVLIFAVGGCA